MLANDRRLSYRFCVKLTVKLGSYIYKLELGMQFSETDKSNPLLRRYRRLKLMSFITEKMPY